MSHLVDHHDTKRVFLGFDKPPLASAVTWLAEQYTTESVIGKTLDLSDVLVVLPTLRSKNRLLQLLVNAAHNRSLLLQPPRLMTIGSLPEHLYAAERPLASELTQHIAWVRAIEGTPREELQPLLGDRDPKEVTDFQSLATVVSKLHIRLANDIWSFNSVRREISADKTFLANETSRWEVLTSIQQRYYKLLAGVNLWDKYGARNYAAAGLLKANEIRCSSEHDIILIGCADLNRSTAEMLRQVAVGGTTRNRNRPQVTALVAASESIADHFDGLGSIVTERWLGQTIPLDDSQLLIADRPADQAFAVAHYLGNLPKNGAGNFFATDQITIGVPDESIAPLVKRSLRSMGLESNHLAGQPIGRTPPARLLQAVSEYLANEQYDSFTSLVRHPDLFDWVSHKLESETWLHDLDVFQNTRLPSSFRIDQSFPFGDPCVIKKAIDAKDPTSKLRAQKNAKAAELLNALHAAVRELLQPLRGSVQAISEWGNAWGQVLINVYRDRPVRYEDSQVNDPVLSACDTILDTLLHQGDVPDAFALETTAVQAFNWIMDSLSTQRVVPGVKPDAIELAGWLDLPLDDSLVMVVTSLNEGQVPTSEIGHQFLPNALCEQLRVQDNNRRYARDAYSLLVTTNVRDHLLLVSGRRDEQGEPLKPSRLLFADSPSVSARRARAFFSYEGGSEGENWLMTDQKQPKRQQLKIPPPSVSHTPDNLTVTSFREYIKCPYRFYLGKVLQLETITDNWRELDGGAFGDLCHNVLEAFANDSIKDSKRDAEIEQFLSEELDRQVGDMNPNDMFPAVRIQVEQLRQRLIAFAPKQAQHRREGWRIVSTEELLEHQIKVDGEPFTIRGKIDRVDQHETTGQVAVWDYKTTSGGPNPDTKHYASIKQKWKDLQLPLYRYLVREVDAVADANLEDLVVGYVLLHEKASEIDFCPAEKLPALQDSADEEFRKIVRKLRGAEFWPPTYPPPEFSDDYAAICQDNVFERYSATHEVTS